MDWLAASFTVLLVEFLLCPLILALVSSGMATVALAWGTSRTQLDRACRGLRLRTLAELKGIEEQEAQQPAMLPIVPANGPVGKPHTPESFLPPSALTDAGDSPRDQQPDLVSHYKSRHFKEEIVTYQLGQGEMGLALDATGVVVGIQPGSQAHNQGVKVGWKISQVDGELFDMQGYNSKLGKVSFSLNFRTVQNYSLGEYIVQFPKGLPVSADFSSSSWQVDVLPMHRHIEVLEIADELEDDRIRARITNPPGWISLRSLNTDTEYVVKKRKAEESGDVKLVSVSDLIGSMPMPKRPASNRLQQTPAVVEVRQGWAMPSPKSKSLTNPKPSGPPPAISPPQLADKDLPSNSPVTVLQEEGLGSDIGNFTLPKAKAQPLVPPTTPANTAW